MPIDQSRLQGLQRVGVADVARRDGRAADEGRPADGSAHLDGAGVFDVIYWNITYSTILYYTILCIYMYIYIYMYNTYIYIYIHIHILTSNMI